MMGAGKSTIGRRLARELGMAFVDTDKLIVAGAQRSIAQLFAEDGEEAFRRRELDATREAFSGSPAVVALGGGAVTYPATRDLIARVALRVYVRIEPRTALLRLRHSRTARPMLGASLSLERFHSLLALREPLYREAEIIVSGDGRTAPVALEIARRIHALRRCHPERSD
ncbi:MAG: shikimate kinase [Candidatus Eremiobacteraeota bacterium]|nr:shikimate kinase [Candidatus Eremiobacteraeota bacterium]